MSNNSDTSLPFKQPLYLFSLPEPIKSTLVPSRSNINAPRSPAVSIEDNAEILQSGKAHPGTSCSTCKVNFSSFLEQRGHARSDFHSYNIRRKSRGLDAVSEEELERTIMEEKVDESLSGSEASSTESDGSFDSRGTTPAFRKARSKEKIHREQPSVISTEEEHTDGRQSQPSSLNRGPLLWFESNALPPEIRLGVYRAWFSTQELEEPAMLIKAIQDKQCLWTSPETQKQDAEVPHVFLCMIGGGHFAGMVVGLAPKVDQQGRGDRKVAVIAHKTFHRYTTRRKQGGAQSGNDSAKGAAHSAGSSLRRYNEAALTSDVRSVLSQWSNMIRTSELLFIRATGSTNRRTIFGPYEGQVLDQHDSRIRTFPFSTRRATQAELMRSFVQLSRVQVTREVANNEKDSWAAQKPNEINPDQSRSGVICSQDTNLELENLHTSQLHSFIRRSKAPALLSYLANNSLDPNFKFMPQNSHTHHHSPTPLHYASSLNSAAIVYALLVKAGADPTIKNAEGRRAFQVAGDRPTRDAFRQARYELGEHAWDWDSASVPSAITKEEAQERSRRDRGEHERAEMQLREDALAELYLDQHRSLKETPSIATQGTQRSLVATMHHSKTPQQLREEESRGMSDDMRKRLEREKRARAAEERLRLQKKE